MGIFLTNIVLADSGDELQYRLAKVTNLSAHYEQVLYNAKGKVLQRGSGEIKLKIPNLFRVDSTEPQENMLVSDGKDLWFYDPFVEQATVRLLEKTLAQTPFILLTSKNNTYKQHYRIQRKNDTFTLMPYSPKASIQSFMIELTEQGKLNAFSTTEKNGQRNVYTLSQQDNTPISDSTFRFNVPAGTEIDDQRR